VHVPLEAVTEETGQVGLLEASSVPSPTAGYIANSGVLTPMGRVGWNSPATSLDEVSLVDSSWPRFLKREVGNQSMTYTP